jgi:E3 ubiquitin-protein ligase UBR4
VATLEVSAEQPEMTVDLPLPVTAINLLFEFVTVSASAAERMQCPRCNRTVTDTRHGVCRQCRENAFQCRLCRNINYEKLDAFLCNECGYCKHARFDWSLVCCTSFTIDAIADEADKAKTIAYWFALTNNTPQKDVQLLYFGHYEDTLEKINGKWLFKSRHVYNETQTNRALFYPGLGEKDPRVPAKK